MTLREGQSQHGEPGRQHRQHRPRPVQTLARAYATIAAPTALSSASRPWVALNEFFHEWWDYSCTQRAQLVAEDVLLGGPPALLETPPSELPMPERDRRWRWAVFCAAVADYLCEHDGMAPPAWVTDPRYTLTEPWYVLGADGTGGTDGTGNAGDDEKALSPKRRLYLEQITPPQFRRRNIFCSERLFANKYEFAQQVKQLAAARASRAGHTSPASQTAPSTTLSAEKPPQVGE